MLLESPPLARAPGGRRGDRARAAGVPAASWRRDSRRRDRLALPARRERLLALAPELRASPRLRTLPGVRDVLPAGQLRAAAVVDTAADRRARPVGPDARHRGPGREDRDHRLGDRRRPSLLRPGRLRDAGRISEGPGALHDGEGDRRAGLRAEERDRRERARRVLGRRLEPRHARRRDRRRKCGHAGRRRPAGLGRRAARVPRQLQGVRRDGLRAEPERELACDRGRDRGRRRGRDGRDQLLGRRAGDRAEPRHRRARARCGSRSRRRAGRRRRKRLQRLRRGLRLVAGQLRRARSRSAPSRSAAARRRGRTPSSPPSARRRSRCGSSPTSPHPASTCSRPSREAAGRHSRERAWPRRTSPEPRRFSASAIPRWSVEQLKSALVQSGVDCAPGAEPHRRPALPGRRRRRAGAGRSAAPLRASPPRSRSGCSARTDATRRARARRCRWRRRHVEGRARRRERRPAASGLVAPADRRPCPGRCSVALSACRAARGRATSTRTSSSAAAARSGESRSGVASRRRRSRKHRVGDAPPAGRLPRARRPRRPALVSRYRYPETPSGIGVTTTLRGPERVFRFRIAKRVANAGVVITQRGRGSRVEPRIVAGARREPADRLRRPAGQPQPVHGRVPRVGARGRRALTAAGRVRRRLRQRGARRRGRVHVPLLGQRRDATRPAAPYAERCAAGSPSRVGDRRGRGRLPASRSAIAVDGSSRRGDAPRRPALDPDRRPVGRHAPPPPARVRLPGVEEHRERRAHPPEHAQAHRRRSASASR